MLVYDELFCNGKKIMSNKKLKSMQNIHELGVNYICNFLERAGFTIHEVNKDPDHHFQLLAKTGGKAMLIAVRTASYPNVAAIDKKTKKRLIKKAAQLNAIPHFAGLIIKPAVTNDIKADVLNEREKYEIVFPGISVVREADSLAGNC